MRLPLLSLTFSSQMTIHNYRLKVLYNLITLSLLVLLLALAVYFQLWLTRTITQEGVTYCQWAAPLSARVHEVYRSKLLSPICNASGRYDYCWDKDCDWNFSGHFCMPVCAPGQYNGSSSCVFEDSIVDVQPHSAFFATEALQELIPADPKVLPKRFFVPIEEEYTIGIIYAFVRNTNLITSPPAVLGLSTLEQQHGTTGNTMTVLLDAAGAPRRYVQPNTNGIIMTLKEILDLAGRQSWLDEPQPSFGKNHMPGGAISIGPIGRITGLEIQLRLVCYNSFGRPNFPVNNWNGHLCTIQPIASEGIWVGRSKVHIVGNSTFRYFFHGVSLQVVARRSELHINLVEVFRCIADFWVFLHIPRAILGFIVVWCLGSLSAIYKQVVVKDFVLPEYICSLIMDTVSRGEMFRMLQDKPEGISYDKVTKLLKQSLTDFRELDVSEVGAFSAFCFKTAIDSFSKRRTLRSATVRYSIGSIKSAESVFDQPCQHLQSTAFALASGLSNVVALDTSVALFDRDRKVGPLERFFTPIFVQINVLNRQYKHERSNCSGDSCSGDSLPVDTGFVGEPPKSSRASESPSCNMAALDSSCSNTAALQISRQRVDEAWLRIQNLEEGMRCQQSQVQRLEERMNEHLRSTAATPENLSIIPTSSEVMSSPAFATDRTFTAETSDSNEDDVAKDMRMLSCRLCSQELASCVKRNVETCLQEHQEAIETRLKQLQLSIDQLWLGMSDFSAASRHQLSSMQEYAARMQEVRTNVEESAKVLHHMNGRVVRLEYGQQVNEQNSKAPELRHTARSPESTGTPCTTASSVTPPAKEDGFRFFLESCPHSSCTTREEFDSEHCNTKSCRSC